MTRTPSTRSCEYLRSMGSPDYTNSGVTNVYKGKYKHVVLPRFATDALRAAGHDESEILGLGLFALHHRATWRYGRNRT